MVGFGHHLLNEKKREWAGYYVDYNVLKQTIKALGKLVDQKAPEDVVSSVVQEFVNKLDFDIARAATFYSELTANQVRSLASVRKKWDYINPETLGQIYEQCRDIIAGLTDAIDFLHLNTEGVRKITKKASKVSQNITFRQDDFLRNRLRPDNLESLFDRLRVPSSIDSLLIELRDRVDTMRTLESLWLDSGVVDNAYSTRLHPPPRRFLASVAPTDSGSLTTLQMRRGDEKQERRATLDMICDLHSAAKQTISTAKWYYGVMGEAVMDYESQPVGNSSFWGLFLNNFNTFLYMANYYIVIPTASQYGRSIGLSPTFSGVLLAMAPLASLLSSVVYSLWSSRSFRAPLLFCTVLLVAGNGMYALALDYQAPWMLLMGRMLVGLGGNRAVNRRYIADFVPLSQRTMHSAIFVAVGSLGMSIGPGVQPLLANLNFTLMGYTVNNLTAPGWVMVGAWILFFFLTAALFREPERRYAPERGTGLAEPLLETLSEPVQIPLNALRLALNGPGRPDDQSPTTDQEIAGLRVEDSGAAHHDGREVCLVQRCLRGA
eukprot:GHVN01077868.1.p1 GENE.GHVN01077868.1~~GHVN01077868.1.p1  ORF type:complete len:548 (+),score=33.23 GHVN01077868.1:95-1738(+)